MNLTEMVFAQALLMAGDLEPKQEALLRTLCRAAEISLAARMRRGVHPEDCEADFVVAASLYALAALSENREQMEGFSIGDLTVRNGRNHLAADCLRRQAEMLMRPYLPDGFAFVGV